MINKDLISYIEKTIFPKYALNDEAHNLEHIKYVIDRSLKFASTIEEIDYDMVYTIAAYHDLGVAIDRDMHEKISGAILLADDELKKFFSLGQIQTMADAVEDHRGSLEYEPRSIYGKIVSSADRNSSVKTALQRTHKYGIKHFPEMNLDELSERARMELDRRFGQNGVSVNKMYFEDEEYTNYLKELRSILDDPETFKKRYAFENHLEI